MRNIATPLVIASILTVLNPQPVTADDGSPFHIRNKRDADQKISYSGSKHKHPGFTSSGSHVETLAWAVHIDSKTPEQTAAELGLNFSGAVGHFHDVYLLVYVAEDGSFGWSDVRDEVHGRMDAHPGVVWYTQQTVRHRAKRSVQFKDPYYPKQWHLNNYFNVKMDINVTGVWERNITGHGMVAVVVDDGLEWTVPDIRPNYHAEGSWDLNSNDADPLPDIKDKSNHHGTRCAGEIAAASDTNCGVGVAYTAGIAGIRVLDGPMTDSLEATAFTKNFDVNDVYSCSWGPEDDGKTVDGPHHLANLALRHGVDFGRQGYGSVYVVASGNGGEHGDNCNYDGYANSIFTLTIGAVDEYGEMPYYAEECASMLAVTFSSGSGPARFIVTSDWRHKGGTGCTEQHSGTSAAAPLAAGMVVLALQARPCLTWRDLQHIIVVSAVKVDIDIAHWQKNAAGLHHSHKHGFGLMDAWRIVNAAKVWEPVPWITVFTSELQERDAPIMGGQKSVYQYTASGERLDGYNLYSLEYVQVTVTIAHSYRGNLEIRLTCPSGTQSVLGAARPKDSSTEGFVGWTFSTVRCWGEKPEGTYTLSVQDTGTTAGTMGRLISWQLKLFGSPMSFDDFQERIRQVESSYSGAYLNDSYQAPCPPPPERVTTVAPISDRVLKILVLTGAFAAFLAVYESLEYIFCYDDEKKQHSQLMDMVRRVHARVSGQARPNTSQARPQTSQGRPEERRALLDSVLEEETSFTEVPYRGAESMLPPPMSFQDAGAIDIEDDYR